jgi:hypothetical protein
MCRAGLIVAHWMAISGASPYSIACRTFQSLAPFSSVSDADRSSVVKAMFDQSFSRLISSGMIAS